MTPVRPDMRLRDPAEEGHPHRRVDVSPDPRLMNPVDVRGADRLYGFGYFVVGFLLGMVFCAALVVWMVAL